MIKKKLTALALALAMTVGLTQGAFAAEPEVPEFDDNDYTEVVVFSDGGQKSGIQLMSEADPMDNINQAKAGVRALKLGKMGFGYIEEACLVELDEMEESGDVILHEYAVLIPKTRGEYLEYCGTYQGVNFYTAVTSTTDFEIKKLELTTEETEAVANFLMNLILSYNSVTAINVTWTVLSASLPKGFEYKFDDYIIAGGYVTSTNRVIYAEEGINYKLCLNRNYGYIDPYNEYHKIKEHKTEIVELDRQEYPDLDNSTWKNAIVIAYGSYVGNPVSLRFELMYKWYLAKK